MSFRVPWDKLREQMCTRRTTGCDVRPNDQIACHLLSSGDSNVKRGVLVRQTHAVPRGSKETAAQSLTLPVLSLHLVLLWGLHLLLLWGWDGTWGRDNRDVVPPSHGHSQARLWSNS